MLGRRIGYLSVLGLCGVFYLAHGEWFSYVLLLGMLGLPWFSLLLSLGAMLTARMGVECPRRVEIGTEAEASLVGASRFPLPLFRGKLRVRSCMTGREQAYREYQGLPTEHCGGLEVKVKRGRVCDYLGLFSFPMGRRGSRQVLVWPKPLPMADGPEWKELIPRAWRPKSGGYAENHELRPYRPGDSMNQIHWKLTAKTGKLTIREPMEPWQGLVLLTLDLRGTAEEIDRTLGRLLWLGRKLIEQELCFEIRALAGDGVHQLGVQDDGSLERAIENLLCAPLAAEGSMEDWEIPASWRFHIGGKPDEES